ncbi:MAG TPA: ATP-binding cassette domain-containing protein [Casimicrobiaceae bacterium]|jgi:ATP-binding cassette subfamily F protein 3
MLRISDLTLARGTKRLLEDVNLALPVGHKAGLIGANGSGKSTLFAAIRGEIAPDAGAIDLPPRWKLAHVEQETPAIEMPAIEYVIDGDRELREVEQALAAASADHPDRDDHAHGSRLAELHHRFETLDGYSARARAATLLAGLGVPELRQTDSVASFSGGFRMRLNLAQALMCPSDLLLLDEPTNHLDLDAVLWLEDWLVRYPGTLLLITHDRDFLDAVVRTIVHVDARKLRVYAGNYTQFERERALLLAQQQAAYSKQQRQIAHLQAFVDRFRAKATKAKQAQSRIRAIERMELIAAAHVDSPFEFSFAPASIAAQQLVRLDHASLGYGDNRPVLADVEWSLLAGARIGLLGPNGAGKSTLLKAVAGVLPLQAGQRIAHQNLRVGYFAQHQVEALRADDSPLGHLQRLEPTSREQALRDYLGGFDIRGDMATGPVAQLSGGEKARLTLALIVRNRPNLLLLDEPTNHLDIEMREALTEALQDYDGALIVVAHDRHLLRATADELWVVAEGRVAPFDGDLDDYADWVLGRQRRAQMEARDDARPADGRRAQKRAEADARTLRSSARKPLLMRQAALEREMEALNAEKKTIDAWLASSDAYVESARETLKTTLARQGELTWQLARLEAEWLDLAEALEQQSQPTSGPGR